MGGGGSILEECYVTKRRYQLERDKLLHGGYGVKMAIFSVTYFMNDPLPELFIFFTSIKNTTNNAYIPCRSRRRKTQGHLQSLPKVLVHLDPVYTRTDPNWYGSEMDPFQSFSSVYTGSDPNHSPFTLGTGFEQFHSLVSFESYKTQ